MPEYRFFAGRTRINMPSPLPFHRLFFISSQAIRTSRALVAVAFPYRVFCPRSWPPRRTRRRRYGADGASSSAAFVEITVGVFGRNGSGRRRASRTGQHAGQRNRRFGQHVRHRQWHGRYVADRRHRHPSVCHRQAGLGNREYTSPLH